MKILLIIFISLICIVLCCFRLSSLEDRNQENTKSHKKDKLIKKSRCQKKKN